mgnify:CR=1 FL=1
MVRYNVTIILPMDMYPNRHVIENPQPPDEKKIYLQLWQVHIVISCVYFIKKRYKCTGNKQEPFAMTVTTYTI